MTTATAEKPAEDTAVQTTGNKPLQVFRHRSISASVFENEAKNGGSFLTVSLQRAYKDGEEFKHSSSFTRDEIPVANHLMQRAWEFILETDVKQKAEFSD